MELRQLRYFIAVADEQSFGHAAERLRMAQSGLSQQIMSLERSLGVRLFDREARPIELTAEGRALLRHARLLVELAHRATEAAHVSAEQTRAVLKLGVSVVGNGPIQDEVVKLSRTCLTDVLIEPHPGITHQNLDALNRRQLDVVFVYVPFESDETPNYLRLGSLELTVALPEDHRLASVDPIPRAELLKEPFLVWPRILNPPLVDHVHRMLFGSPDHPHAIEIPDIGTSRSRMRAEGLGIGPIAFPDETLFPEKGIVYRRIEDPPPTIEYGMVWFDDHVCPVVPAFVEVAQEVADAIR